MLPEFFLILNTLWSIIKAWWWVFLPFILWKPASYFWLYWRRERFLKKQKPILLEIKIPAESVKPTKAMEEVFAGLWQAFWDPPRPWEKWWDGHISLGFQLETVSLGGEIHFYIRCPDYRREIVETNIYSQYPDAEITLAEDYTKNVPQNIPNQEWDLFGADYCLVKPDPYPIKTYPEFEREIEREEKRVDPIATLLEVMAKIKPGEQLWLQIQASPIAQEAAEPFLKEGEAIKEKLAKRPAKPKPKPIFQEAAEVLITGKPPTSPEGAAKGLELIAPELRMTPGEKEIITGVERKISKPAFRCSIRFIFLGKRDVWFKPNLRMIFGFFGNYVTQNMNAIVPLGKTISKVYSIPPFSLLDARRLYLRKRKIFRHYRERTPPYYPRTGNYKMGTFILNTEELASLYHFPSRAVAPAPGVPRVEVKKAPPTFPLE